MFLSCGGITGIRVIILGEWGQQSSGIEIESVIGCAICCHVCHVNLLVIENAIGSEIGILSGIGDLVSGIESDRHHVSHHPQ